MYYNYHAQNIRRIKNGELVAVLESDQEEFALYLLFNTYPYRRPIRRHAIHKYERFFSLSSFQIFFKNLSKKVDEQNK